MMEYSGNCFHLQGPGETIRGRTVGEQHDHPREKARTGDDGKCGLRGYCVVRLSDRADRAPAGTVSRRTG